MITMRFKERGITVTRRTNERQACNVLLCDFKWKIVSSILTQKRKCTLVYSETCYTYRSKITANLVSKCTQIYWRRDVLRLIEIWLLSEHCWRVKNLGMKRKGCRFVNSQYIIAHFLPIFLYFASISITIFPLTKCTCSVSCAYRTVLHFPLSMWVCDPIHQPFLVSTTSKTWVQFHNQGFTLSVNPHNCPPNLKWFAVLFLQLRLVFMTCTCIRVGILYILSLTSLINLSETCTILSEIGFNYFEIKCIKQA